MSIWRKLLSLIGLRPISAPRKYGLTESMQVTLTTLSEHDGRPEEELIHDLLAAGLTHYYSSDELWKKWETLTPREREVVALVCLGYTNRQVAVRMSISPETVKYHLRNVFIKYGLKSRSQLQQLLQEWDFDAWQK